MSEKKKKAVALLEEMPEDKVDFVIEFIRQLEIQADDNSVLTPKMADDEKELAQARDEKYGCFD